MSTKERIEKFVEKWMPLMPRPEIFGRQPTTRDKMKHELTSIVEEAVREARQTIYRCNRCKESFGVSKEPAICPFCNKGDKITKIIFKG